MQVIRTVLEMQSATGKAGRSGFLGLVPTMGALHEGHLSLVRRARAENDAVAATIFVNPLQFGANEDLDRYPRTFEADCELFEREDVDLLFAPSVVEMYGAGAATIVDPGPIAHRLDGASRPGHFVGVATVVAKLFHIATADRAYFGQKDAAQLAVIRQVVRDLNFPVEVVGCPIVRDADGLALSSRNRYLSPAERKRALALPRALEAIRNRAEVGERTPAVLLKTGLDVVAAEVGVELDYLAAVDAQTLLPVDAAVPGTLVAIAARVGATRLIDNMQVL
jgi:pantoate--beta-alanine ligase